MDDADRVTQQDAQAMERFERSRSGMAVAAPSHPVHCLNCGEVIANKRLQAVPTTRRCMRCQLQLEKMTGGME